MRREHTKYMLLKVKNETCYFIISVLPECTWFPPPRFILPYCSMYTALSDQSVWCQSDNSALAWEESRSKSKFLLFPLEWEFVHAHIQHLQVQHLLPLHFWCHHQLNSFFWRHQSFMSNLLSQRMLSYKHFLKCFHMIQHFTIFLSYILKKYLGFP